MPEIKLADLDYEKKQTLLQLLLRQKLQLGYTYNEEQEKFRIGSEKIMKDKKHDIDKPLSLLLTFREHFVNTIIEQEEEFNKLFV